MVSLMTKQMYEIQKQHYLRLIDLMNISGLDKIEFLQSHENMEIYQKAFDMIEMYFGAEEEDTKLAPTVDQNASQFQFNPANQSSYQF